MEEKRIKDLKKGALFYKDDNKIKESLLLVRDGYNRKTKRYKFHYYYDLHNVDELPRDRIVYC